MGNSEKNKPVIKKRVEFKIKINIWRIALFFLFLTFFLPFLVTVFDLRRTETNVDISQALSDIKQGKVKDVLVQNERLILNYEDGSTKT